VSTKLCAGTLAYARNIDVVAEKKSDSPTKSLLILAKILRVFIKKRIAVAGRIPSRRF
jgi:hypothetical protein